jgi:hypothetical protein
MGLHVLLQGQIYLYIIYPLLKAADVKKKIGFHARRREAGGSAT